jgi:hypothetical protein
VLLLPGQLCLQLCNGVLRLLELLLCLPQLLLLLCMCLLEPQLCLLQQLLLPCMCLLELLLCLLQLLLLLPCTCLLLLIHQGPQAVTVPAALDQQLVQLQPHVRSRTLQGQQQSEGQQNSQHSDDHMIWQSTRPKVQEPRDN